MNQGVIEVSGVRERPAPSNRPPVQCRYMLFLAPLIALVYMLVLGMSWYTEVTGGRCGFEVRQTVNGVAITTVDRALPAADAGLKPGDVILTADGEPASAWPAEIPVPCTRASGQSIAFEVQRAGPDGAVPLGQPVETVTLLTRSPLAQLDALLYLIVATAVGVLTMAVAVAVVLARPDEPGARYLLVAGSSFALSLAVDLWWPVAPWVRDVTRLAPATLGLLASSGLLHLFLAFPAPHPLLTWLRSLGPGWLRRLGGATFALYLVWAVAAVDGWFGLDPTVLTVVALVQVVLALLALVRSYQFPPTPLARNQLKWVLWALSLGVVCLMVSTLGPTLNHGQRLLPAAVLMAPWGLFPIAIGIAVLRYRLFDVDSVLRASLVWPILTASLAASYVAVAFFIGEGASALAGPSAEAAPAVSLLAALSVAALATPLYRRVQELLDGFIYRDRHALRAFLDEATEVLGRAQPPQLVAAFLTEHGARRLELEGAWLLLPTGVAPRPLPLPGGGRLLPGPLLARLDGLTSPLVVAREDVELSTLPVLPAADPLIEPWYEAGVRLLVPLRSERAEPTAAAGQRGHGTAPPGRDGVGSLLAVWALGLRRSGDLPSREELDTLMRVARQAAVLLDYARLYEEQVQQAVLRHEIDRAREVQTRLLPATLPSWPGRLEIAVRFRPARDVSGDFYDVLPLAEAAGTPPLQIALGDVVGKGIGAAMVMAMTRTTLRAVARRPAERTPVPAGSAGYPAEPAVAAPSPAETLRQASAVLHGDVGQGAGGSDFVACALAVVEWVVGPGGAGAARLRLANAAQVPPLLCRAGVATELVPDGERLPLGVLPDAAYGDLDLLLDPGDVVVFASDGLPEAPRGASDAGTGGGHPGEMWGFARLAESAAAAARAVESAEAVAERIWAEAQTWSGSASGHDDATLVVLRVPCA